jgi:hypothetical protein
MEAILLPTLAVARLVSCAEVAAIGLLHQVYFMEFVLAEAIQPVFDVKASLILQACCTRERRDDLIQRVDKLTVLGQKRLRCVTETRLLLSQFLQATTFFLAPEVLDDS